MKSAKIFSRIIWMLVILSIPTLSVQSQSLQTLPVPTGTWECWDRGNVDICLNTLNDLAALSSSDVWAVGGVGTILHYNGSTWTKVGSPVKENLYGIEIVDAANGWAVGGGGTILYWNGTTWTQVSSPTTSTLRSISMSSATSGWAVGDGGTIIHWDGSSWVETLSPVSTTLRGVSAVKKSTAASAVGDGGIVLWFGETGWETSESITTNDLLAVQLTSATNVWVAGKYGTVLKWNGTSWTDYSVDSMTTIRTIVLDFLGRPIVGGNYYGSGQIFYWQGGTNWQQDPTSYLGHEPIYSLFVIDSAEFWAAGEGGAVYQIIDGTWHYQLTPYVDLLTVEVPEHDFGWSDGGRRLFQWQGDWTLNNTNFGEVFGSASTSRNNIWFAMESRISHWNGNIWEYSDYFTPMRLYSIDLVSELEGWAVGADGTIGHGVGLDWSEISSPTINTLNGVDMLSATDGWAVGNAGTILHWDGVNWSIVTSPTTQNLLSISMVSPAEGWASVDNATLLRWNGVEWLDSGYSFRSKITELEMTSSNYGWGVGADGIIIQWDGLNWAELPSPTDNYLADLDIVSPGEAWAVGANHIILHFVADPVLTLNYTSGAPGSYFSLHGAYYPGNSTGNLFVNGEFCGAVNTDKLGEFDIILSTAGVEEGIYTVEFTVNPTAQTTLELNPEALSHPKEGEGQEIDVSMCGEPYSVYLPLITR